jgi:hypothetical protein
MKIYVASSWRNKYQSAVVISLRALGHEVYDFRKDGFSWSEVDPNWERWTAEEYYLGLQHLCAQRGFDRDMNALKWCDMCIMVMPCGPSASMEMGYAVGAGKLVAVYMPEIREPDLMVKMAHHVSTRWDSITDWIMECVVARK